MYVLCFESGGTKLVGALADAEGRLLERRVEPRRHDQRAEETIDVLVEMGRRLAGGRSLEAVGFGFGGTVRRSDGRPLHCYHEGGWGEIDAAAIIAERLGLPVFIENDCNLAALAEAWTVREPPAGCLFYVTLGTGVGGGLVREGRIVRLGEAGEAEIGHLVLEPDGIPCPCGNRGCLEMYCSGPGLQQLAGLRLGESIPTPLLMQRFREGHEPSHGVVDQAAKYLSVALAAAINLFAPQHVILGGGVMSDNRPFLELVRTKTEPLVFPPFRRELQEMELSRCGTDVVCRGAGIHAWQQLGRR